MASRLPSSGRVSALTEAQALARTHTTAAISVLAEIMQDGKNPAAARVAAANSLLDRGWGRATQRVEIATPLDRMGDEDLQVRIQQRLAQIAQEGGMTLEGEFSEEAPAEAESPPSSGAPVLRLIDGGLVRDETDGDPEMG